MRFPATYFDGKTPRRHAIEVVVTERGLRLVHPDGQTALWTYEDLRQTQGDFAGEELRFEHELEAVVLSDRAVLEAMHALAPASDRQVKPVIAGGRMLRAALLAVVGLAMGGWGLYSYGLPALADATAAWVPQSWEETLGEQALAEMVPADERCPDPARVAALQAVVDRLKTGLPTPSKYTYQLTISRSDEFNAYALPGGHIVVNQGLLAKLRSGDELAGILAHEMQHVEHRHVTKAICEDASTRVLIAGLLGNHDAFGQALNAAKALGELGHSRKAEDGADRDGMTLLVAAGLDPAAMVAAYGHLEENGIHMPSFLSTHPDTASRIQTLQAMAKAAHGAPRPLDLPIAWKRVQEGCK